MAPINLFDLYAKISLDDSEYNQGVDKAGEKGQSLASKLGSGLATAGKTAAAGLGVIAGAASTVVGGLVALESSTEEYRKAQGRLNTAFEAAGYSTETAAQAYNAFYGILGDTDTATEASQLLAKLAESEEDVATWTNIAAGVSGTFGDSLPIEGLIEASNETAKVGQVTGSLADALNWAGISEDEFNAKLAACGSESERNQLIMSTLSGTYDEASAAFYRNNEALVQSRSNQAQLDAVMSSLGGTVTTLKNNMLSQFLPAITSVTEALANMISGADGADEDFSEAVQGLVGGFVERIPDFMALGGQIIGAVVSGVIEAAPGLIEQLPEALSGIGAAISSVLPEGVGSAVAAAFNGIGAAIQFLTDNANWLIPALAGVAGGIAAFQLATGIAGVIQGITTAMSAWRTATQGMTIAQALLNTVMNANPFVLIITVIGTLVTAFVTLMATNENFRNAVVNAWNQIVSTAQSVWGAIVEFFTVSIPQAIQAALDWFSRLPSEIAAFLSQVVSNVATWVSDMAAKAMEAGSQFVQNVVGFFTELPGRVADFLSSVIDRVASWVTDMADKALEAATEFGSNLITTLSELPGRVLSIGADIVHGIWQGISNAAGWLWNQITGWLGGVVDGIKGWLGIASPSKLMRDEVGRNIGLGVAEGIMDTTDDAVAAASSMGQEVYNSTARWVDQQNRLMGSLEEAPEEGLFGASVMEQLPLMMEQLQVFFEENLPLLQQIGVRMMTAVAGGFEQTMPELFKLAPIAVNTVVSGIRGRMNQLVNIGAEMVRGIWRGIEANKEWILNNFLKWIGEVLSAVKSALQISSPSKVFRDEVGKNIGLGVVEGIVQTTGAAVKAAENMGREVYAASAAWLEQQDALAASYEWTAPQLATQRTGAIQQASQTWGVGTLVQNIQAVPLTPAELARQSVDAIRRLRWA